MKERQKELALKLIDCETYLTTKDLAALCAVSERTIHNDLNVLDHYLKETHSPLEIERKKGIGILLKGLPAEKTQLRRLIKEDAHQYDEERLQDLLVFELLLTKDGVSLDELSEKLFISRPALRKELNNLQDFFLQNQLELVSRPKIGTFVAGEERKKRAVLANTLRKLQKQDPKNPSLREFFAKDTLSLIQHTLKDIFTENKLIIPPELSSIDIHIYFMLERMKQGQKVDLSAEEHNAVKNTQAQQLSSQILGKLAATYPITFSPDEINYLALRIASVLSTEQTDLKFQKEAVKLADYLVDQIQQFVELPLAEDPLLKENLVSHLLSTYFRLNYDLPISNPLTKDIFSTYTQLFLMLQLVMEDYFKEEKFYVPQSEIAYLTIHFQAAIERQQNKRTQHYRTILISEYSKAMATFLEARIKRELPELEIVELIEFQSNEVITPPAEIDFVLSTVPFTAEHVPVLQISPMINEHDLAQIMKYMLEHIPKKKTQHLDLSSFTSPFLIFPQLTANSVTEVLLAMGEPLIENHYVTKEFLTSVLERENRASTRVAPLVALPHGNPLYVKRSTVSIATLKEPMDWHGEEVQLVILLSIQKAELKNQEIKKLFSVIHYLDHQPEIMKQLLAANNPLEIIQLLSEYE